MFKQHSIPFKKAGILNSLVLNYVQRDEQLSSFYTFFPDTEGFEIFLNRKPYKNLNRDNLASIVLEQSKATANLSELSRLNISKLAIANTYTVTTGHQLVLFTGPLYFIYKIISTLNLAENLKKEFPKMDFVPVYWMASEDHDFEEVSSFNAFGKKISWQSSQSGAVGDFETAELSALQMQVEELFGKSEHAVYLNQLFENAYLNHKTLAEATRFIVNELFGEHGIVIIDGNDKRFKTQFKEFFKDDIFNNSASSLVNATILQLQGLGYEAQVNPRLINCFYLEKGSRKRIEKNGELYNLVGTNTNFTKAELENIIETTPEKISPNVVLRPVYQQCILPNIAYVGGPGELAYWLEFKNMFDAFGVEMPLLVPRDFVSIIDKGLKGKIDKLSFKAEDFFKSEQELIKEFQVRSNAVFSVDRQKEQLAQIYNSLSEKIALVDKTLSGTVSAELQKAIGSLDMLSGKANKALKQRSETEINQIKGVKQKLFPEGVPQERYENFSVFYLKYGKAFITELKGLLDPFMLEQKLLLEE